MKQNNELMNAVYNARTEIHYNEYAFRNKIGQWTRVELKGKIKCPLLNCSISHQICSHLMDKETWPRGVDPEACKKCDCYINLSIARFQNQNKAE